MAEASVRRRFLFVSNGHGEDWIAAAIVARLPKTIAVDAYPMIGAGSAYNRVCPIVGPRATLASEGWRNVKGSMRRDLATGGLATVPPALKFLRGVVGMYDRVVVVGDMVGVIAANGTGHRGIFYLDVYKTGAARLYSLPERWLIKQTCKTVFCRANNLALSLRQMGVDARCTGNPMMDTIPFGEYDAKARRTHPLAVTLLPGSRALTAESFALQIAALRRLSRELRPDIFLAVASTVQVDDLTRQAGLQRTPRLSAESGDLGELTDGDLTIHMARGDTLGNLVDASDVVLSQAGTATIQALGSGKPVITFINPRDRRSRFSDEQALFGNARIVVPAEAPAIGTALERLLADGEERRRLGAIGRQRIGGPGATKAILETLVG
ncbi:MAG TPA: hypothetical protein VGB81_00180 [Devosia sp.]